jgi:hypothetical protein
LYLKLVYRNAMPRWKQSCLHSRLYHIWHRRSKWWHRPADFTDALILSMGTAARLRSARSEGTQWEPRSGHRKQRTTRADIPDGRSHNAAVSLRGLIFTLHGHYERAHPKSPNMALIFERRTINADVQLRQTPSWRWQLQRLPKYWITFQHLTRLAPESQRRAVNCSRGYMKPHSVGGRSLGSNEYPTEMRETEFCASRPQTCA